MEKEGVLQTKGKTSMVYGLVNAKTIKVVGPKSKTIEK